MSLRTSESKIQNNQWGHSEAVSAIPTTQIQVKFPTRFYKLRVKKKLEMHTLFFFLPSESALAYWVDSADVQRFLLVIDIYWHPVREKL